MDKTTVTYLGHSAWIVDTPNSTYIFDYDKPPKVNSIIDLNKLQSKQVYVFSTHNHGDHYSTRLNEAVSRFPEMTFIAGGFNSRFRNNIIIQPRQTMQISDFTVTTAASTDVGVCYLVQAPGLTVFHSGDLADWPDNEDTSVDYFKEIDYIAEHANTIDISFIPVNTFDWYQDTCLLEGAVYAVKKLNPLFVFPMHANGREDLYKTFAKYAADRNIKNTVICMEHPGDTWISPDSGLE